MEPLRPAPLSPGAVIGIVAPARWPVPAQFDAGVAWLKAQGFKVSVHPQVNLRNGALAGDDAARAGAINAMFADPAIDAILCARGGKGSLRLLDQLDLEIIRDNPKIFCGFSDLTTLLTVLTRRTGLVTFHGPMLWNFTRPATDPRTMQDWLRMVAGRYPTEGMSFPARALSTGRAEGPLLGGNLNLLRNLIGTPEEWDATGKILFFEDINEPLYKIDHMLWQLRAAGKFTGVRGIIVGDFTPHPDDLPANASQEDPPYDKDLPTLLRQHLPPDIPVCMNFPCGHEAYLTTLPLGTLVVLEVAPDSAHLRLLEPALRAV